MVRAIWDNRNNEQHIKETSVSRKGQYDKLDIPHIVTIFAMKQTISNSRCISHNTAIFFRKKKEGVKVRRKLRWVQKAGDIIEVQLWIFIVHQGLPSHDHF